MKTPSILSALVEAILPPLYSCLLIGAVCLSLPACSTTQTAAFNSAVKADLASPAGRTLVADLLSDATTITAATLAQGKDLPADVAAADSLGGTFEAFSTLPTTTAQLSAVASDAASTSTVLTKAVPTLVALVDKYKAKGLDATTAIQTLASGVYAATGIQQDVSAVKQVAAIGNP